MTRTLAHSLDHISKEQQWDFKLWSLYDSRYDVMKQYLDSENFIGFGRSKRRLAINTISKGTKADILILSHINLALIGIIVKILNPKCKMTGVPQSAATDSMAATRLK